jgi:hypothetical protein
MEEEEETPMDNGLLAVLSTGCTVQACMEEMMPMDVLRFQVICREVHSLVSADDVLVAKFAVLRWYCAGGSLSIWRAVWQQCVEAAALRGWNASVWAHAEMMIEADQAHEFDGRPESLGEFEYRDLWGPHKDDRALVADRLEDQLVFVTERDQEVLAILASFMLCSPRRGCSYWSFMLLLADGSFAAVHIDDYYDSILLHIGIGSQCEFSATPHALNGWSIDDGGRVLMSMSPLQTRACRLCTPFKLMACVNLSKVSMGQERVWSGLIDMSTRPPSSIDQPFSAWGVALNSHWLPIPM